MLDPEFNISGIKSIKLVTAESLRRIWERGNDYTVFQYFFLIEKNAAKIFL